MEVVSPKPSEGVPKPRKSVAHIARLHVRNREGKRTTISLDPMVISILAAQLGSREEARAWLKDAASRTKARKGISFSRMVQTAAVRQIRALSSAATSSNPL